MAKKAKKGKMTPDTIRTPKDVRYWSPKDPEVYRIKRMYWLLMEFERKIAGDVTKVNIKDYLFLIQTYTDAVANARKKGKVPYVRKEASKQGVEQSGLEAHHVEAGTSEIGGDGLAGVGAGISSSNPLT